MLMNILMAVLTSNMTKTLIGLGIKKLLEMKGDGITKDIAEVMIDGIARSKHNPTTAEVFTDAVKLLKD